MDIDHIPAEEMAAVKERILNKKDELHLLMLEVSARQAGYHLVFKRRIELSQEDNLRWASNLLGVEYDKGAKDITRVFFTTSASEEDLLFLDDEIFEIEECPLPAPQVECIGSEEVSSLDTPPKGNCLLAAEQLGSVSDGGQKQEGALEEATTTSLYAFDHAVRLAGLEPDKMDVWGVHNWHSNLMAVLSVGVAKLMSREQLQAVIQQRLPNYSQTEDCRKLVNYFYEKYDADKGFMNKDLREINVQMQKANAEGEDEVMNSLIQGWNPP